MEKSVSLLELLNLSIGSPNKSSVNFSALHKLLLEMLKLLDLQGATTRFTLSPPLELDSPLGEPLRAPIRPSEADQLVPPGSDLEKLTGSVSVLDGTGGDGETQAWNLIEELKKNRDDIKQKTQTLQSKASNIIEDLRRDSSNLRDKAEELQHKALKVIQQLHDSKSQKEKTDGMQHEGAAEQMDIKAGLEECCQRLDFLDKAVESMQELFEMYPDPEKLIQCVTWVQLVQEDMETEKEATSEVPDQPWLEDQTEPDPSAPASGTTAASDGAPAPSSSPTVPLPSAAALPSGSSSPSSGVSVSPSGGPLHLESSHPSADTSFPSISAEDRSLEAAAAAASPQASSDGSQGGTITGIQGTATEPQPVTSSVLPGSRPETLPHPGAQPAAQPASQYGAQPAAQPGSYPAAQPGSHPGSHPAAQPASQYGAQPAAQPGSHPAAQPAAQPGAQPAAQPTAQPASQYGAQPGAQPAAQPTAQYGGQPGSQPAAQPGAQPGSQYGEQYGAQPAAQPGEQYGAQPAAQPAAQPGEQYGAQPAAQPAAQPGEQYGAQPAAQYGEQYGAQPAAQYGEQYGSQPAAQPGEQYGSQPAAQPGEQYGAQPGEHPASIRGDMKRFSDSPESRKRFSDSPENRKRFSDSPENRKRFSDSPENRKKLSDSPESRINSMQMEEFLKNIRKLLERVTQLEAQTRILEEQKVDWTGLAQFISSRGNVGGFPEVPGITIDQVQQHQTVMENLKTALDKPECLEDMLRNIMSQGTGSSVDLLDSVIKELAQQVSDLRSSLVQVEKEVEILKEKQGQSEESPADHLQVQLTDLQETLEDTIVSLTSQLSSNLQLEVDQETEKEKKEEEEEEEEEEEALSESVEVGRKISQLFENYEQLEDTVNLLVQQQGTARDGLDEDRGMGRSLDLVYDVQRAIQELQAECERLQEATRSLHEDNQQKQEHIEELYKTAEELQVKKADKLMVESEIKADKLALESKVSRLQFDAATEQLASMLHELLNKMSGQEHDWHQLVDKLSTDMECKLNRMELDSVKLQLEERWRGILKKLQAQSAPLEDDAAGIRKKLLEQFHCLSCDRVIKKQCPGPIVLTLPTFSPFPPPKSAKRWTLEQVRQNYPSLTPGASQRRSQLRKTHAEMLQQLDSIEYQRRLRQQPNQVAEAPARRVRPVGAPQASMSAGQRRSGPQQHRLPTRAENRDLMQETNIIGRDGRIYKGRFSINQPKDPETKLPDIASKDGKLKEGTKIPPEDPEAEPRPPATPPPLSTKSLNPSPPASSGSDPDWAVSPLGSGSPPSAAESQPLGL